jgi:hypothetical protein
MQSTINPPFVGAATLGAAIGEMEDLQRAVFAV